MRSPLRLPLAALLVFGCNDSPDRVTAPTAAVPNGRDEVDLDGIAANLATQAGVTARCVQLRYVTETGVLKTKQKGSNCTCSYPRAVSVTAVIWNGALFNNVIGKASCLMPNIGTVIVAGPATAVDPGGGAFAIASVVGLQQPGGTPGCTVNSTVSYERDRSSRLVLCVWH
jgi:hypothetical protein